MPDVGGKISQCWCLCWQGDNPFSGNQDDQDPEDSMVMEVSEQELISEAIDGETAEAPAQPEGEAGQEEFVGEAPEATGEDEEKMEEEKGTHQEEVAEEEQHELHEIQEEDEGFELGGEEEGYVVQDEISEGGLHAELEDEGLEVAEEEKNDEWLLHPGSYCSSDWSQQSQTFFLSLISTSSSVGFTCLYYLAVEERV